MLLGFCLGLAGCGGPDYATATVSGAVTVDGQPASGQLTFTPQDRGPVCGAEIREGKYRCQQVPAGEHKVTFLLQAAEPTKVYDAVNDTYHEVPADIVLSPEYQAGVDVQIEPGSVVQDFTLKSGP